MFSPIFEVDYGKCVVVKNVLFEKQKKKKKKNVKKLAIKSKIE